MSPLETPLAVAEMAVAIEMVSKRSARTYVDEDGNEHEVTKWKRGSKSEESILDDADRNTMRSRKSSIEITAPICASQGEKTGMGMEGLSLAGRPVNFGTVVPGVYRSSYPKTADYNFIEGLKLKTIVTLVQKDLPDSYQSFIAANGIRHVIVNMKGTKKEEIPLKTMKSILRLVLDQKHHPVLIHCNHGKHRTGCVVAVVRKMTGWDLSSVIDEYKSYAEPKVRECDVKYITAFEPSNLAAFFGEQETWKFRMRNFLRTIIFTVLVLTLWMVSGTKIGTVEKRSRALK